jgi:hypothetical protein
MEVFIGYKNLSAKSYRVQGSWWQKQERGACGGNKERTGGLRLNYRIERVGGLQAEKRAGGSCKRALSSSSNRPRRGRAGGGRSDGDCRRAGPRWRPRGGAKRRGDRGQPIQPLTLVGDSPWRWIDGGGRTVAMAALVVVLRSSGKRWRWLGRCASSWRATQALL